MKSRRDAPRIPVIMYHGVGPVIPGWLWSELTCAPRLFAGQLAWLGARGYRPLALSELRARQAAGSPPSDRRVVLTFDDGYLDNWTYVCPLLRRAGWHATVYVNPDFVDPGETLRPTLADVWAGRCAEADLPVRGFMNWAEMRRAQADGVLEIACHSRTHTWYPTGPEVVDYHRPGAPYPWLAWNAASERKHAYLAEDQALLVPWGTPVHVNGRSLGVRRYIPDPGSAAACARFVAERGGAAFFDRPQWRAELDAHYATLAATGRVETDEELARRLEDEILGARDDIARALGAPPRHFAWPGGAYTDTSWRVAERAGFETIVVTSSDARRWETDDPRLVRRTSCFNSVSVRRWRFANDDPRVLWHACEAERGSGLHRTLLRAHKLRAMLRTR